MHKSQYIPIVLIWMYIIMYFFIDLQIYADLYFNWLAFIDTFLLTSAILYYFTDGKQWSFTAKRSLFTVILLNILTESVLGRDEYAENYYKIYTIIIYVYLLQLLVNTYLKHKKP